MRKRLVGHYNQADVDMTPMLDVVFILLIFFIVTATFLNEHGLEMVKPPTHITNSQKIRSILVRIDAENAVFVQSKTGLRRIEPAQLLRTLRVKSSSMAGAHRSPSSRTQTAITVQ